MQCMPFKEICRDRPLHLTVVATMLPKPCLGSRVESIDAGTSHSPSIDKDRCAE